MLIITRSIMYRHDNVSNALVDGQFVFLLVLDKSYRLYFTVVNLVVWTIDPDS
jgi:hypothetical protein